MNRMTPRRLAGLAIVTAVAALAAACSTGDTGTTATTAAEPPTTTTAVETTTVVTNPTTSEPGVGETQAITVDAIGVTSAVPQGWTMIVPGVYTDGEAQLVFLAFPGWAAPDPSDEGLEPLESHVIGGRTWEMYTDAADSTIYVAATEIDQAIYVIQLAMPPLRVDHYVQLAAEPALEAFEVHAPIGGLVERADVTIDGRDVAYAVGGSGQTTVVFEAGLGSDMGSWSRVADTVAQAANVFLYDRAGIGGSGASDQPREGLRMVEELRAVLSATGHEPPYVLVGHSLGGTLMELYARTHPSEVGGLVLIDGRPATYTERCLAAFEADDCVPSAEMIAGQPEQDRLEWQGLETTEAQVRAAGSVDQMPAVIVAADRSDGDPARDALWVEVQRELADELGATFVLAENTGHSIQFERPDLVLDAIETVVTQSELESATESDTP